jgi:hypothetical protein
MRDASIERNTSNNKDAIETAVAVAITWSDANVS